MSLRNIAIIAHVDHGKTTLVDCLLKQAGTFRDNQTILERALDSGDLEKERGITILAKCTSIEWKDHRINIVDTPGHADFGAEVERILAMVDGVIILVDAAEGVMPQTKFVVSKALALGLNPIVVINKADKADSQVEVVYEQMLNLFINLDANEKQLDFPLLYASGRDGWADFEPYGKRENLDPLLETILNYYQKPAVMTKENIDLPFSMLATLLDRDPFLGRIITGRIESGKIQINDKIKVLNRDAKVVETARANKLMSFRGLDRLPVEKAIAGDIISIAGLSIATVTDTLCHEQISQPLVADPIDPPILAINFSVNDSPLAGKEGTKLTSRMIYDRLKLEAEGNVAIKISQHKEKEGSFEVAGRGELQLGVLVETMRREGFELAISRPKVLYKKDEKGNLLEPFEEVVIDLDEQFSGTVIEKMNKRKAQLQDIRPSGKGKNRLIFIAPSRGLIGYHSEFLTDTKGSGVINRLFHSYQEYRGKITSRSTGVMIAMGMGKATGYDLWNLEARGSILIEPGQEVYEGMIIGEHNRDNDLDVNILRGKQLTNIRAAGKDEAVKLTPAKKMSLEQAIAYINDDELVEVSPKNIRLRKLHLKATDRKKYAKTIEI